MTEREEFIQSYMGVFLASYAALNYDRNCIKGWPNREQPVEDAKCLAEEAWQQLEKVK